MSSAEKLLAAIRDRSHEPLVQRLMLAEAAATYGDGLADHLRAALERDDKTKGRRK